MSKSVCVNGQAPVQVIKCRDDKEPVFFEDAVSPPTAIRSFKLTEFSSCSWAEAGETFGSDVLRHRIEPWLTALVQSEHLSLLVGSGLTHAVHGLATNRALPGMGSTTYKSMADEIATAVIRTAKAAGREAGNFEDQIRVATELIRGLEIIVSTKSPDAPEQDNLTALKGDLTNAVQSFTDSILSGERSLKSAPVDQRNLAFNYIVSFLMSFASRSVNRERLHIFTTNYDRFIEAGADVAGLRLIDRFVGTLAPVFRASRLEIDLHYNPPGIRSEPRYVEGVGCEILFDTDCALNWNSHPTGQKIIVEAIIAGMCKRPHTRSLPVGNL